MKPNAPKKSAFQRIAAFFQSGAKSVFFADPTLSADAVGVNFRRLLTGSLIAIPVSAIHIAAFALRSDLTTQAQQLWRTGIIVCHSALLVLMCATLFLALRERKKPLPLAVSRAFQFGLIAALNILCAAIVSVDQLVTSSITPFLVFCAIVGAFLLIRPLTSLPLFLLSYLVYFFAVGLYAQSPAILLTNRVNGLTAIALGFALSAIMWRHHAVSVEQRDCIERQKNALERLAYTDPLTGLSNRRFLNELVEKDNGGKDAPSSLIVLDIDDFKRINDVHGHPGGDAVLRQFGRLLQNELRAHDTISRMGGEEFVILLNNSPLDLGVLIAQRLRDQIERHEFSIADSAIRITASFGVALLDGADKRGFFKSYAEADKALYRAKLRGKNCVEVADEL